MGRVRNIIGLIGIGLVGMAVYGLLAPDRVPEPSVTLTGSVVIVLLVLGMTGIGVLAFRSSRIDTNALLTYHHRPEQSHESVGPNTRTLADRASIDRQALQDTLTMILQERGVRDIETIIAEGTWTDDRVAAAFVTEDQSYPIIDRLRAWLEQEGTTARRLKRTIQAMEQQHERDA